MQAIASLSRGVGVALQGVVRGVVRNQSNTEPARAGGTESADSRLGDYICAFCFTLIMVKSRLSSNTVITVVNLIQLACFIILTRVLTSMFAVTAVSGFPKPGYNGYNIDNILKGQIGDDAYFVARHVDEWGSREREETPEPLRENSSQDKIRGNADVIGVADGVGGWRQYGVDPGLFSNQLMRSCERLVQAGFFQSNTPSKLLEQVLKADHLLT